MKNLIYPAFFLLLMSCDIQVELKEPEDLFIIKKGQHSTSHPFRGFDQNSISFDAQFFSCAKYKTADPENQADINKLAGFSSCNTHHQENSARIGWRWFNQQLEIFAYVYDNGQRSHTFLTAVPLEEVVHYEIIRNQQGYLFKVNELETQVITSSTCSETANYMLWPYFGGDETAPHDISIKVDLIEGITTSTDNYNGG